MIPRTICLRKHEKCAVLVYFLVSSSCVVGFPYFDQKRRFHVRRSVRRFVCSVFRRHESHCSASGAFVDEQFRVAAAAAAAACFFDACLGHRRNLISHRAIFKGIEQQWYCFGLEEVLLVPGKLCFLSLDGT